MTVTVCPINPPGHDWQAGLTCRWCEATRTPGEAVLSGLASVRGWSRDAAQRVRDAYRAEVLAEADLLPKADVVAWLTKKAREFRSLGHEQGRAQGDAVAAMASKVARGAVRPNNLRMGPADFFEPGRTYTREHHADTIRFLVEHVSTSPDGRYRVAHGWRTRSWDPGWEPSDSDDFTIWVDVTEAGDRDA